MFGVVEYNLRDDSFRSGSEVGQGLLKKLGGACPGLVLAFPTVGHDVRKVVSGLQSVIPGSICGCSVYGNITSLGCDESTFSLSAIALNPSKVALHPFVVPGLGKSNAAVGQAIGKKLKPHCQPDQKNRLLLIFPDAFTVNVSQLVASIAESLPYDIPIAGGFASNDYQVSTTYQFLNDDIQADGVSGVLLVGDFRHTVEVSHGSRAIGAQKRVTRARENTIYEIDGEPALVRLRDALGEGLADYGQLANVVGIGLPFRHRSYSGDLILRAVMGFDEEEGSIRLGAEVPEGADIYFTVRDRKRVSEATRASTQRLLASVRDPDAALYMYINCDGRGSYLYGEPQPDVENMHGVLGKHRHFGGFFSLGEIAPMGTENLLHNFTGVLLALEEET